MTNTEQLKKHEPDGLLAQHHLLIAATLDQNLSQGDLAILSTITEGYWPDTRRAFASHLGLAARTGLSRVSVIRGLKRLTDQGYIVVLAAGRRGRAGQPGRATEYLPSFDLVPDKEAISVTPKGARPYPPSANCIVDDTLLACIVDDTIEGADCIADDTISPKTVSSAIPPPTPSGPKGPVGGGRNEISSGVGTPPPGATPDGADQGVPPAEGFEELVAAYGVNRDIEAARSVYAKLAPDAGEHRNLVTKAATWRARYDEIERAPRFRKSLHNWLQKKHYREDLPEAPVDRKAAAIAKARTKSRDVARVASVPAVPSVTATTTFAPMIVKVIATDVAEDADDGNSMSVEFLVVAGEHVGQTFGRVIRYGSVDGQTQLEARSELAALCIAAGVKGKVTDTDVLLGAVITASRQTGGRLHYAPAAANDDQQTQKEGALAGAL